MAQKEKSMKDLQTAIGEMEVEKSKLMEQIAEINLKQQQINTQIYQMVLDSYKTQSGNNLILPTNGDGRFN